MMEDSGIDSEDKTYLKNFKTDNQVYIRNINNMEM